MLRGVLRRAAFVGMLGLLLLAAGGDFALAVKDPVDIPDTHWLTAGEATMAVTAVPKLRYLAQGTLLFAPLPNPVTPGHFDLNVKGNSVPFEFDVTGLYTLPKPGKPVLTVDVAALMIELGQEYIIQKVTLKAKPKKVNGVDSITILFNLKARKCTDNGGTQTCTNLKVTYKGVGGHT